MKVFIKGEVYALHSLVGINEVSAVKCCLSTLETIMFVDCEGEAVWDHHAQSFGWIDIAPN